MSLSEIRALFQNHFGESPDIIATAPGRINLIGEHTDYNDGFVFPAAIDRRCFVAAKATDGPSELFSRQSGNGEVFDTNSVAPGQLSSWSKYPAGMAWALKALGHPIPNLKVYVDSSIPIGSGVSSSAAMELAFGVLWNRLGEFGLSNARLALLGQICENRFVGVNSGIMDQMASAMGREAMAMFMDTRSLNIEYAPIPRGTVAVLCDTKKERSLTSSAYNERRNQCEQASAALGVSKLRDATLEMLESARNDLEDVVFRRAKHVITENGRCEKFRVALESGDLGAAGRLMRSSHESLRDDYEVSCFELDVMADAAGESPACIGARMMGGGFGGACIALVYEEGLDQFKLETEDKYRLRSGNTGSLMACSIVDGAQVLWTLV